MAHVRFSRTLKHFGLLSVGAYFNSQRHVELIILREALVRLKEFGISMIICRDPKNKWRKLFDPNTSVNWKIFTAFADIISLSSSIQVMSQLFLA